MDYTTEKLKHPPKDVRAPASPEPPESGRNVTDACTVQILIDADHRSKFLTYAQYVSTLKSLALALHSVGMRPQSCVSLLSYNSIFYWVLGDAAVAAGGIFAAIASSGTVEEVARHLRIVEAEWLFVEPELMSLAQQAAGRAGIPSERIYCFNAESPASEDWDDQLTFSHLLSSSADESEWEAMRGQLDLSDGERICFRILTSGTTGSKKGVDVSHRAQVARLPISRYSPTDGVGSRALYYTEMHRPSGLINYTTATMGIVTLCVTRKKVVVELLDLVESLEIVRCMAYPRILEDILVALTDGTRDPGVVKSLRAVVSIGSYLRPSTIKKLLSLMHPDAWVLSAWGTTEVGFGTYSSRALPAMDGYVGYPPADKEQRGEIIVIDPETLEPVGRGIDGEICCRGPTLFSGYTNDSEATASAFITNSFGTWYRTGDKGHLSATPRPQLAITGRYTQIFQVGNEEVMPDEVEAEIRKLENVKDVVIIGALARNGVKGQWEPLAYVVEAEKGRLTAEDIVEVVKTTLSDYKAPTGGVVFCQSIPRDGLGKVQRGELGSVMELEGTRRYLNV